MRGKGIINDIINKLPVELHIPGYNYCGPGTKLHARLSRGDVGVNPLDEACKNHDIAYSLYKDLPSRYRADKNLAEQAWSRVKAKNSTLKEKAAAWAVTNIMKLKTKAGMGISFNSILKKARKHYKRNKSIKNVIEAARRIVDKNKGKKVKIPRVIQIPKSGGVLPFLVPLFAGLSALGSLAGGTAGIVKAVNDAKDAKKRLEEFQRHNRAIERVKIGNGMHIAKNKKKNGLGLYITPFPKNY